MKQNKHRTLKLALLFSVIIFSIMTLSMLLIGVIIVMLYYTGHLGELDTLFLLIWFIFPSLITGIVIAFLVAIKGLQPVLKMCDAITKVAEGDFSVRFKEKYLIYEVSQMAECFNVMVKELDNMNTVHTNFINNVSHEFRTPLSAIEGYAALLGNEQINKADDKAAGGGGGRGQPHALQPPTQDAAENIGGGNPQQQGTGDAVAHGE